jgi:hypothetical protein
LHLKATPLQIFVRTYMQQIILTLNMDDDFENHYLQNYITPRLQHSNI